MENWSYRHILVCHCCIVTDVQFGVALAGARGVTEAPEASPGTLGWFGGADVQEILEHSSVDRRQDFQNEGAWAEVVLKI